MRICTLCHEPGPVDSHGVCPGCVELNTCPVCRCFTRYTVVDGGGVVCAHCDPAEFKRLVDDDRIL